MLRPTIEGAWLKIDNEFTVGVPLAEGEREFMTEAR